MRVKCEVRGAKAPATDLLCVPVLADPKGGESVQWVDNLLGGQVSALLKAGLAKGKAFEIHRTAPFPKQVFRQLLLVGLGDEAQLTPDHLRRAAGIAGKQATDGTIKSVTFVMPNLTRTRIGIDAACRAIVEGVNLGSFFLDAFKSSNRERTKPQSLTLLIPTAKSLAHSSATARLGLVVSDMQNHCRQLSATPSNVLTPRRLAVEARKLAAKYGLRVQVSGKSQIERLKMGAFLAVAKGSAEPPQLIRLDYQPKGTPRRRVILVGKGITFDTGGISLKPAAEMDEMKQDMTGAAVVMCAIAAIAQLRAPIAVTAFVPACENMPGSRAYKPGDILTTSIGKTIEIINTDAEGRLLLADVLGYAAKMKPDYLIDVATLTGAARFALGHAGAPILSTSEELVEKIDKASGITGEKVWRLPLWSDYEHQIQSSIADMKNSGGRPAGTITAALILKKFVGDVPWLHLDIAAMDLEYRGTEYTPKGASGFGVRLLTETVCSLASR